MALELALNIGLLALGAMLAQFAIVHGGLPKHRVGQQLLLGALLGFIAALVLNVPIKSVFGATFDTRAGPIVIAGFVAGPWGAAVAATIAAFARHAVGGPAVIGGMVSCYIYAVVGWGAAAIVWKQRLRILNLIDCAILGFAATVLVVPSFFIGQSFGRGLEILTSYWPILLLGNLLSVITLGLMMDLVFTQLKMRDEHKARLSTLKRFATVFMNSPQAITVTDSKNAIEMVNPAFEQITGYQAGDVLGKNPSILSSGRQPKEFYKQMWATLLTRGTWQGEIWNRRKNGEIFCEWLTVTQLRENNEPIGYVAMFSDVTARKEMEERLEWTTNFDPLTNLPNRRLVHDRLGQAARLAERSRSSGAVVLFDLDQFKDINDDLGHEAGDTVLIEVGRRVKERLRASDTIGRMEADEFALVISGVQPDDSLIVASKIKIALALPLRIGDRHVHVDATFGVAIFPNDGIEPPELLRKAEVALRNAKAAQKGSIAVYSAPMQEASRERLKLLNELRSGIERGEIELFFQPIVDLTSGLIVKAEGLVRWRHPERGLVPPVSFLELAEETGLILPIGELVLKRGLHVRNALYEMGIECDVGINLSAKQLNDPKFLDVIARVLDGDKNGLKSMVFEITESQVLQDFNGCVRQLEQLAQLGGQVALDDFGTGYSSLKYLSGLPADILKMDKSFVDKIGTAPEADRLVTAIIDLGHDLGLRIVAEGVEVPAQREFLQKTKCDLAQGYLFAKPMPEAEFFALLKSNRRF